MKRDVTARVTRCQYASVVLLEYNTFSLVRKWSGWGGARALREGLRVGRVNGNVNGLSLRVSPRCMTTESSWFDIGGNLNFDSFENNFVLKCGNKAIIFKY